MFTFLPQCTVHNMRISELGVPVYSFLYGCIKFFPPLGVGRNKRPRGGEWKKKGKRKGNGKEKGKEKG